MGKTAKRIARSLELAYAQVERFHPCIGQLARPGAVVGRVQLKQLPDFLERESGGLGLPDETKTAKLFGPIAADRPIAGRSLKQAAALVKADRLHSDPARRCERPDGERMRPLTLYHSTGAI